MEVREMMLLTEHEVGKDLSMDPAGIDVVLQMAEAATNTQIRLDETLKTCETLTQVVGERIFGISSYLQMNQFLGVHQAPCYQLNCWIHLC